MFNSLFKNLQNSLTELSDFIEEGQKKMNKDELKLFNSYKGRISEAAKKNDINSLHSIMSELQSFTNKKEAK